MTYYAYPLGAELVAFLVWCALMVMVWATFKVLVWAGPKVAAVWHARRSAGEVAEVPEDFDTHCDRALRPWHDTSAAEENPLLREIYAAQSLAREGTDIYSNAPKELTP